MMGNSEKQTWLCATIRREDDDDRGRDVYGREEGGRDEWSKMTWIAPVGVCF